MKKIAFICLLLLSLRARADLVVVEETEQARQQPQSTTIKIKGDKYRIDYSDKISIIYDLDSGGSIRIDHSLKTFRVLTGEQAEIIKKNFTDTAGTAKIRSPRIVDTGKKEKLNGYDTEVYTTITPSATYTFWVAKDFPDFEAVNDEMKKIQERNDTMSQTGSMTLDLMKLDGQLIRTERLTPAGQVTTVTLVSAKIQPVDDVVFQTPTGYKDITAPPPPPRQ